MFNRLRASFDRRTLARPRLTLAALATIPVVAVGWAAWPPPYQLDERVLRDTVLYLLVPGVVIAAAPRRVGFTLDREILRATALLTLAVTPLYIVAASIPSVRAIYPLWETSLALPDALVHVLGIVAIVTAVETYYRGVLCVALGHLGPASILAHLPLYVYVHLPHGLLETGVSALTGLFFGAVAYRTKSVVPTITAHAVGLATLDLFVLLPPVIPWL
jgi:hypothetical protein